MKSAPRALLCDIDGVLRLWPKDGMAGVDRAHGLPEGTLAATAFHPDLLLPAITGRVSDVQWRESVAEALTDRCGGSEPARAVITAWNAVAASVNQEMAQFLTQIRTRLPVLLVSNATDRLDSDLAALGLDGFSVVNSSQVGAAKPDPRIYRVAAERAGVDPCECLFVDDSEQNVTAARDLGFHGVWFHEADGPRAVREILGL